MDNKTKKCFCCGNELKENEQTCSKCGAVIPVEIDPIAYERNRKAIKWSAIVGLVVGFFKITFTFNYKDGTKTVFLSEVNCTPSGSDIKCLAAPDNNKTNPRENLGFVLFFTRDYFGLKIKL